MEYISIGYAHEVELNLHSIALVVTHKKHHASLLVF
jgi:hypothetical protein